MKANYKIILANLFGIGFVIVSFYLIYLSEYLMAAILFLFGALICSLVDEVKKKLAINYFRQYPVGTTNDVQVFMLDEDVEMEYKELYKLLVSLEKLGYIEESNDDFWVSKLNASKNNMITEEINLDD